MLGLSIVSPSSAIWIGLWHANNNHRYAYDTPGGTPSRYNGSLAVYSATNPAPDPWNTAADSTSGQEHSQYVVYTVASNAPTYGGHRLRGKGMASDASANCDVL